MKQLLILPSWSRGFCGIKALIVIVVIKDGYLKILEGKVPIDLDNFTMRFRRKETANIDPSERELQAA